MNHPFFCFSFRQEHFLIENQQSATDDRYGPCLYVDSDTAGALIKVTGCNETDERQSWYYTPKGQVKVVTMVGNIRTFFLIDKSLYCDSAIDEPLFIPGT